VRPAGGEEGEDDVFEVTVDDATADALLTVMLPPAPLEVPDLVVEACGHLGIAPVRDAFAQPANNRFPAYWIKEEVAFAQPWDDATSGSLWATPPFSRLDEVVTKAAPEVFHMLIIAPEWPAPQYPW